MSKPKLLWVGDAVVSTGFARVTHSVLEHLRHKWDVYVVGLNYLGQPHPYRYPIWPAQNGGDIWGLGEFAHLAPNINPDAICVLNDPWIVAKFASEFDRRGIPMAAYMPVDAKAQSPDVCHRLNKLDLAVFYTRFGERECRIAGFKGKSAIIPHGVDTSIFRPIPRSEARARLELSRSVTPDAFIIGNVNRNQPRKRLDLTVQYFAEWLRQRAGARDAIKNAYLFIHCAQRDSGWNLAQLARYYGVEDRIMLPDEEAVTPAAGLPDAEMPYIYSAFDVQVTTTMGEGWGLCVAPETVVQTTEGAETLGDISAGEYVLSSDGMFHQVQAKAERTVNELLEIRASGAQPVVSTPEHPFLRLPKKSDPIKYYTRHPAEEPEWTPAQQLVVGDLLAIPRPRWSKPLPARIDLSEWVSGVLVTESDGEFIWSPMGFSPSRSEGSSISAIASRYGVSKRVAEDATHVITGTSLPHRGKSSSLAFALAQEVKSGFVPATQLKLKRFIDVNAEFLNFIGWYLAEGSPRGGRGIEIDLHAKEINVAKKLAGYINRTFGIKPTVCFRGKNKCSVRVCSSILSSLMKRLCGTGARTKVLHPVLWESAVHLAPLVRAYAEGDGHIQRGYRSISTASIKLAWQMKAILAVAGIYTAISETRRGLANKGNAIWIMRIGGDAEKRYSEWTGHFSGWKQKRARGTTALVRERYIFVPIRSIRKTNGPHPVVDIQVEGAHDFTGNGFSLHNSQVEGMACGIPQIMPCFSALAEWPAGAAHYVSCSAEASHIMINTIGGIPDKAEFIRALDLFYRSADARRKYAEAALVRAREPRFRWDRIAEQFDAQLNQMVSDARARTVSPEPSATGKEQEENGEAQEAERIPA